ncbi:MAG TPA: PSD1 and planctomycete cytochrome C domain-containing protein [Planctomycetaceae bacterium]|nr:PSD1 and planctomycete cytochrome C domain-containing protein [Planctomycetaceae bacterium]
MFEMTGVRLWRLLIVAVGTCLFALPAMADGPPREIDYLKDIKPILTKHCTGCHGADKQKSGLRLDAAALARKGGDSGPAIEPGKSSDSLLIQAVTGAEGIAAMPPKEDARLSAEEIGLLSLWIDQGAKAPAEEASGPSKKGAHHWAFRPVVRPAIPEVAQKGWVANPIDAFVLARLEKEGLQPSPQADRVTLIRRLSFDLLGLPPTIDEVDAFVADSRAEAYDLLVDRLLASPHYGERWGRHWLDLARYADSNGFTRDFARSIWKYRDWVIDNVNCDKPFDQFAIEQIAGDMLPGATAEQRIATGFHRNTLINEEGGTDPEQFRVESVVDRVNTTGIVFLGLTVGCAQCHEHKYDPISQREFYQLFAFLNNADEPKLDVPTPEQVANGLVQKRDQVRAQIAGLEQQFQAQADAFKASLAAWEKSLTEDDKKKLPPEVLNAVNLTLEMRNDQNTKELIEYYKKLEASRKQFPILDDIARLRSSEPQFITTMIMQERAEPRETHIHVRGDFLRKGARVEPGVPAVLPALPEGLQNPSRVDFARWLVDPRNPLTPRVTMNRVWQKYFGRGIVETENDFGTQGTPPSHPELLDWLAAEFVAPTVAHSTRPAQTADLAQAPGATGAPAGAPPPSFASEEAPWSLKRMHKLIVTSATYRQSSNHRADLAEIDAGNRLYARQSRLRLDAEIIRDVGLAAGGLLNTDLGGPSVYPPQPDGVFDFTQDKKPWNTEIGPERYRRGMYTYLWRSSPYPAMTVFDFPDANVSCTRRNRSNTPLQSLTLANDQQFVEIAQGLAVRVLKAALSDDQARLRYAFRVCLAREPKSGEGQRLAKLLALERTEFAANLKEAERLTPPLVPVKANVQEFAAWTSVARVLLNLDEFITRE